MADSKIQVIIEAVDRATDVFNSVAKGTQNFGNQMTSLGRNLSMGLTAPLVGIGVLGVKMYGDFNAEIERAGAFVNATTEEVDKFRKVAIEAARGTSFSAKDAATMLGSYVGGTITAEEATKSLGDVINIALVSKMNNLQEAANLSSTALIQFKKEGLELTDVMDIMATVASNVSTQTGEYARELTQIMAPARLAGMDFKQVNILLSALVSSGAQFSTVGTSINRALKAISVPSKQASEALDKVGLSTKGLQDALQAGPIELLEYLKIGFDKAQESGQGAAWTTQVLGAGAMDFTLALGREADALQEVNSYFEETEGKGNTLAEAIRNNIPAFDKLKNVFSELFLTIGQELNPLIEELTAYIVVNKENIVIWVETFISQAIPVLISVGNTIKSVWEWFNNLDASTKTNIATIIVLMATLGHLLIIFGTLITSLAAIFSGVTFLISVITFLLSPIGLLIIAFGVLIGLAYYLYTNFDIFKNSLGVIANYIQNTFLGIVDSLTNSVQGLINKVSEALSRLAEMARQASISNIGAGIGGIIQGGMSAIGLPTMNDFISRPGYLPVSFSPQDTIIGMKNPAALGAGGITVNINGGTYLSESVAEEIGDMIIGKLKNQIRI